MGGATPRGLGTKDLQQAVPEQRRADLVVMGAVGRTGLPGFFDGNTAATVLSQVPFSALAVKPEGFVSPVTGAPG